MKDYHLKINNQHGIWQIKILWFSKEVSDHYMFFTSQEQASLFMKDFINEYTYT